MDTILPLKSVREEDAPLIGTNLYNLAKLSHLGFPVAEGILVLPPEIKLRTILEYYELKDKEIFEQRLTLVRSEIAKIPVPEELDKYLQRRKINSQQLWQNLLEVWLSQIRSQIWREGFSKGLTLSLTAEPIFFTNTILMSASAYFDPEDQEVKISVQKGPATPPELKQMDELVAKANKKLFIPQVYHFINDGKTSKSLKLVKLIPFTQTKEEDIKVPQKPVVPPLQPSTKRSSVKVYLDLQNKLSIHENVDSVLVSADSTSDFERQVFQLVETAHSFPNSEIIFKLSDKKEKFGGVRGAMRLIHQKSLLSSEVEAYLFARNKKQLSNLSLALPFTRSSAELQQLKRELASLGLNRKPSLKFWFEVCTPENIINLKSYLEEGIDGVIFNIDELAAWTGGFDPSEPESVFYKNQITALLLLLEGAFKVLHSAKLPIMASGSSATQDQILEFLLEKGLWGLVVPHQIAPFINEHLHFLERRLVRRK